jgi:hypothetical protein
MRLSDLHKRVLASKIPINLLPNLVAYWDFDGNGTDSVNAITPILETDVTYNNDSILGTSAAITANNAILRYADRDDFSFVNPTNTGDVPFSISCWVFFTAFTNVGNWLINKRTNLQVGNEWQFNYLIGAGNRLNFQKFQFDNINISQRVQSPSNPFVLNTWYHIAVTDKGTANFNDMNMYINGVNVSEIKADFGGTYTRMNNGSASLGLFLLNESSDARFIDTRHQGRLDEVAIWKNRELTPEEITYLYNAGAGRTYPL